MINVQEGQCDISGWNFRETCFKVLFEGMTVLGCMLMFLSTVAQQKVINSNTVHWCLEFHLNFNLNTDLCFSFDSEYFLMHWRHSGIIT